MSKTLKYRSPKRTRVKPNPSLRLHHGDDPVRPTMRAAAPLTRLEMDGLEAMRVPFPPGSGIGAFASGRTTVPCALLHPAVYHEACDPGTEVATDSIHATAADLEHRRADGAALRHDETTLRMISICVADCPMRSLISRSWCSPMAYLGTWSASLMITTY
jgi:hypothetical protein